jgi:hypothetical protein
MLNRLAAAVPRRLRWALSVVTLVAVVWAAQFALASLVTAHVARPRPATAVRVSPTPSPTPTATPDPTPLPTPTDTPAPEPPPPPPPPPRQRTQPLSFGWGLVEPDWPSNPQGVGGAESLAGRHASIIENYVHWGSSYGSFSASRDELTATVNHGSLPMVTWMSDDGTTNNTQPYDLRTIAAGGQDDYVRSWADGLKTLGARVMVRLDSEMNGFWMPYAPYFHNDGTTAADFVAMWRHVHDIFTAEGVTNVVWVWSPNVEYGGVQPMRPLYPGDRYVDVMAVDGYNWGNTNGKRWQTFSQIFDHTISVMEGITGRPLMLGETGSSEVGGSKAAWISDMFDQIAYRGDIHGFIWFDIVKETDWRIGSSPSSAAAFARGLQADLPPGFS